MPIPVTCPECGDSYSVADRQLGKKIRCRNCDAVFPVEEEERNRRSSSRGFQSGRAVSLPQRSHFREEDEEEEDDYDDRPRRRQSSGDGGGSMLILGGSLAFLLLAALGVGIWVLMRDSGEEDKTAEGSGQTTELARALERLKAGDQRERQAAADWLAAQVPDPDHQIEVLQAVGPLQADRDPQVRRAAQRAVRAWSRAGLPNDPVQPGGGAPQPAANADVNTLLARVEDREFNPTSNQLRQEAMTELGRRKEARGAGPIARQLTNFFDRGQAEKALADMGPVAEKEVLAYLHHPDGGVRQSARKLLDGYGTKTEARLDQTLRDLESTDKTRQRSALDWLSATPPVPAQTARTARAVEPLLADRGLREPAMKTIVAWGSRANVPAVVKALTEPPPGPFIEGFQKAGLQFLAQQKDERGVVAACAFLGSAFGHVDGEKALREMGPVAGKEVVRYMHHPDGGIRGRARKLLEEYKTPPDVLLTQTVADLKGTEAGRRKLAAEWLVQTRPDEGQRAAVASGLGQLLKDQDHGTQAAAVKALVVWGTKENVPGLLTFVEDGAFNPHANFMRGTAMEALGAIKDERAVIPVARRLINFLDRQAASKALKLMGPIAEPAVMTFLGSRDGGQRNEACRILAEIGTARSLPALQVLARGRDRRLALLAAQTIQAIQARK
jgi:predicted Zn finger-like uncharacterized protein